MSNHRNISIVWDFDGTLTPDDSTSKIIEHFLGKGQKEDFWKWIKELNGSSSKKNWERMLSSDAPAWMYVLSRIAFDKKTVLSKQFFSQKEIKDSVTLYPKTKEFLNSIKKIEKTKQFKASKVKIHHFIVTAGLKEFVEELVPKNTFSSIWGGRYRPVYSTGYKDDVESVPVFCMDERMKTRAL